MTDPMHPRRVVGRLRALLSGRATPQRLRRLGALLVIGCLATALASGLTGWSRADAVGAGGDRLAALDFDAAELYRSLNEAGALATSGFGAEATASPTLLAAYDSDIAGAGLRLVHAAELLGTDTRDAPDAALVEQIAYELPRYAGTVDTARALRAQDSPRAQAELDGAAQLLRTSILPASDALQQHRRAALTANYEEATGFPALPVLLAVATLAAIGYVALRERRRTNRILNVGLVVAGVLVAGALVWWLVATVAAAGELATARASNDRATLLSQARVTTLQVRADETVDVASGTPVAPGSLPEGLSARFGELLGPDGVLDAAGQVHGVPASGPEPSPVDEIRTAVVRWQDAVRGEAGSDGSRVMFVRLTSELADGIGADQGDRSAAVDRADADFAGIAVGPSVLLVGAAVAAVAGIGVRLREYRG